MSSGKSTYSGTARTSNQSQKQHQPPNTSATAAHTATPDPPQGSTHIKDIGVGHGQSVHLGMARLQPEYHLTGEELQHLREPGNVVITRSGHVVMMVQDKDGRRLFRSSQPDNISTSAGSRTVTKALNAPESSTTPKESATPQPSGLAESATAAKSSNPSKLPAVHQHSSADGSHAPSLPKQTSAAGRKYASIATSQTSSSIPSVAARSIAKSKAQGIVANWATAQPKIRTVKKTAKKPLTIKKPGKSSIDLLKNSSDAEVVAKTSATAKSALQTPSKIPTKTSTTKTCVKTAPEQSARASTSFEQRAADDRFEETSEASFIDASANKGNARTTGDHAQDEEIQVLGADNMTDEQEKIQNEKSTHDQGTKQTQKSAKTSHDSDETIEEIENDAEHDRSAAAEASSHMAITQTSNGIEQPCVEERETEQKETLVSNRQTETTVEDAHAVQSSLHDAGQEPVGDDKKLHVAESSSDSTPIAQQDTVFDSPTKQTKKAKRDSSVDVSQKAETATTSNPTKSFKDESAYSANDSSDNSSSKKYRLADRYEDVRKGGRGVAVAFTTKTVSPKHVSVSDLDDEEESEDDFVAPDLWSQPTKKKPVAQPKNRAPKKPNAQDDKQKPPAAKKSTGGGSVPRNHNRQPAPQPGKRKRFEGDNGPMIPKRQALEGRLFAWPKTRQPVPTADFKFDLMDVDSEPVPALPPPALAPPVPALPPPPQAPPPAPLPAPVSAPLRGSLFDLSVEDDEEL
ncbi:hypothetical protein EK21DRAFT_110235 [Setomelanomma holmii]|uniref:Uncharacterized protein n=1 Tax=Setomelanomma holmii TaxID=210430 RepID=A0A9P4HCW5_9PLEO|nr:hypothetical protein EK21DRAFT_110235 [Setomelanomma holmii]